MHAFLPFLFALALPEGFPSRSSPVPPESSQESVPALACLGLKCAYLQFLPSLHSPLGKNLHGGGCAYEQSFPLVQLPFSRLKHFFFSLEGERPREGGGGELPPRFFPIPFGELARLFGSSSSAAARKSLKDLSVIDSKMVFPPP